MKEDYIKRNILPIAVQIIFILCCLVTDSPYHIYINFIFYMTLAVYFYIRKDFVPKDWWKAVNSSKIFRDKVSWTVVAMVVAVIVTLSIRLTFPQTDSNSGMILLQVNNYLELILFAISTIILPPIVEESFYRKNLISFENRKILILTTLLSMFLYALEHALSPWGILFSMIWALPFSISYIKTKNIYVPMTAHLICNIIINGFTVIQTFRFIGQ